MASGGQPRGESTTEVQGRNPGYSPAVAGPETDVRPDQQLDFDAAADRASLQLDMAADPKGAGSAMARFRKLM